MVGLKISKNATHKLMMVLCEYLTWLLLRGKPFTILVAPRTLTTAATTLSPIKKTNLFETSKPSATFYGLEPSQFSPLRIPKHKTSWVFIFTISLDLNLCNRRTKKCEQFNNRINSGIAWAEPKIDITLNLLFVWLI